MSDSTVEIDSARKSADTEVSQLPRTVTFGDFAVPEDPTNRLSPGELSEYETNFNILQKMASSAETEQEKQVITGPMIRGFMGFAAESSFENVETASLAMRALARANALDRFALLRGANSPHYSFHLINLPATERIIRSDPQLRTHLEELGIDIITDQPLEREQLLTSIKALSGQEDGKKAVYARGVLSGFPSSAVESYTDIDEYDRHPLIDIEDSVISDLVAHRNISQIEQTTFPRTSPPRADARTTSHIWNTLSELPLVQKFGVSFRTDSPVGQLKPDELQICQRLIEIDRRLGLTNYLTTENKTLTSKAA